MSRTEAALHVEAISAGKIEIAKLAGRLSQLETETTDPVLAEFIGAQVAALNAVVENLFVVQKKLQPRPK